MQDPAINTSNQVTKLTKKHKAILTAKAENPALTTRQIAKLANTDHSHVVKTLQRYGVDHGAVESYQKHRADIFDGVCSRLLASVTDSDINKASLMQRMASVGVLYDKMRIERGLSDGTSKPLVMIQVAGSVNVQSVHNPVDNPITQPQPVIDVV